MEQHEACIRHTKENETNGIAQAGHRGEPRFVLRRCNVGKGVCEEGPAEDARVGDGNGHKN